MNSLSVASAIQRSRPVRRRSATTSEESSSLIWSLARTISDSAQ